MDIALRSIENDLSVRYDKSIIDKDSYIKDLEAELLALRDHNESVNVDYKDKEKKYIEQIDNLENLKYELIKTYNHEINQLKALAKLNESSSNRTSPVNEVVENVKPTTTTTAVPLLNVIPATGGSNNESLYSSTLVTLHQSIDEDDEEQGQHVNVDKNIPTINIPTTSVLTDSLLSKVEVDEDSETADILTPTAASIVANAAFSPRSMIKEAKDELLEEKENFIKELQNDIEDYKHDLNEFKLKYDELAKQNEFINEEYMSLKRGNLIFIRRNRRDSYFS